MAGALPGRRRLPCIRPLVAGDDRGRVEVEPVAHVQLEPAAGFDVGPEQRGQRALVGVAEAPRRPTHFGSARTSCISRVFTCSLNFENRRPRPWLRVTSSRGRCSRGRSGTRMPSFASDTCTSRLNGASDVWLSLRRWSGASAKLSRPWAMPWSEEFHTPQASPTSRRRLLPLLGPDGRTADPTSLWVIPASAPSALTIAVDEPLRAFLPATQDRDRL